MRPNSLALPDLFFRKSTSDHPMFCASKHSRSNVIKRFRYVVLSAIAPAPGAASTGDVSTPSAPHTQFTWRSGSLLIFQHRKYIAASARSASGLGIDDNPARALRGRPPELGDESSTFKQSGPYNLVIVLAEQLQHAARSRSTDRHSAGNHNSLMGFTMNRSDSTVRPP